jgi:formylglycine-generating enzyme required for sulfatase activity
MTKWRTAWISALMLGAGLAALCAQEPAAAKVGSLSILCPVACRISIPELQVNPDAAQERLQLEKVPAGTYTATFSAFNRQLAHTFTVVAGQTTRLTVKIAQGKVIEGGAESTAAKSADPFATPTFVIPELGVTMVAINPGTFIMGSDGANRNELPLMKVTLTRRYWLSRTEVTQAQWLALMETNNSRVQGPDQPVERVTWTEAMQYCQRLTQHERAAGRLPDGYFFILPLEAQWEFACRAGRDASSEDELRSVGWYQANSGGHPHPVGLRPANAWGLQDLRGNVAEWCYDWLDTYAGGVVADYAGPATGTRRAIRGGAFDFPAFTCRATARTGDAPDNSHPNVGFRLALMSLPPKAK